MKTILGTILSLGVMLAINGEGLCQKIAVGARDELHVSAGYNFPVGAKKIDNQFCLLSNMKSSPSFEVRYMTTALRNLYLGAWVGVAKFTDWSASPNALYDGTSINFFSIGPSVTYKPGVVKRSRNKTNFCITFSPGISRIKVSTDSGSEINGNSNTDPLTVQSQRFTFGTTVGLNHVVTHSFGFSILAGYQYTVADSQIFPDKNFSYFTLRTGVFYRLFKDKKYKYSGI